jgi:hypothetical protein
MKTNKETKFIHRSYTGQFDFYTGQKLTKYDTLVTIPAGVSVTNQTAMGIDKKYHFINDFSFLPLIDGVKQYGLIHDLTYHGANVPKEFIDN